MTDLLEIPLYDDDLVKLAYRFAHNLLFLALVVRFAWHPRKPTSRERDFAFATVMLNITVFFICYTMKKLDLSLGMALGLFAIFGVLRYRTDAIRIKDMTYLFIVIGLAVVNALTNKKTSYLELLAVNTCIVAATFIGEWLTHRARTATAAAKANAKSNGNADANAIENGNADTNGNGNGNGDPSADKPESPPSPKSRKQTITYDNLALLHPDRRAELIDDLRTRTHLPIDRVRIERIDLPNNTATLSTWHPEPPMK